MKIDGVGLEYVGDEVFKRYKLIVRFAGEVSNILAHFADAFRPRSFEEFLSYGFNDLPSRTSIA